MKLKNKKIISISLLVLVFPSFFAFYYLQKEYKKPFFNDSQNKIWAHRGLSVNFPENSLESINAAFKSGFPGVEIDIWFDSELNRFIVSHDDPDIMKTPAALNLQTVLDSVNTKDYLLWLDLKNVNASNVDSVLSRLTSINNKYKIKDKVFIESHKAKELHKIGKSGFFTAFFLKPVNVTRTYQTIYNNLINLFYLCIYDYNAVTMPSKNYHGIILSLYQNQNVYLWSDNLEKHRLIQYTALPEVKIILFNGNL